MLFLTLMMVCVALVATQGVSVFNEEGNIVLSPAAGGSVLVRSDTAGDIPITSSSSTTCAPKGSTCMGSTLLRRLHQFDFAVGSYDFVTLSNGTSILVASPIPSPSMPMMVRVFHVSIHRSGTMPVFELTQTIPSQEAFSLKVFTEGAETFLFVTQYSNSARTDYSHLSTLYRLNETFIPIQSIPTTGAFHAEVFSVLSERFLALSQFYDPATNGFGVMSKVFKWNKTLSMFIETLAVDTIGATMFKHFHFDGAEFLFLTQQGPVDDKESISTLYTFNATSSELVPVADVLTRVGYGSDFFEKDGVGYLVVANYQLGDDYNQHIAVYTLQSDRSPLLVLQQTIPCVGCIFPNIFEVDGHVFVGVAGLYAGTNVSIASPLYVFNARSLMFEYLESVMADAPRTWMQFTLGSTHFCAIAEGRASGMASVYYFNNFCVQDD